jgi:tetratricopeptide (TPR) repeat protein
VSVRRTLASVVVAFAAASAAYAGPDPDPLEPLRAQIERQDALVAKRQFDQLLVEARQKAKDGTPETLYLLGRALGNTAVARRAEGKEDEARRLLDESQRCFEDAKESGLVAFAPAHLGLARCARSRGDLAQAEAHLRQALKIAPAFKGATVDLAQVLTEAKRPDEAEFVLREQLRLRPNDPDLRILLGMVKLTRQRFGEAEAEFRAVVQLQPDNPVARKLLGGALLNQRNYAEAAEQLDRYRQMAPKDEEAYRVLFLARMKSKDRAGAQRVLDDARRELPGTEVALWAERVSAQYQQDPAAFEEADEHTPQALVKKIESADPKVVAQALTDMLALQWQALPARVYGLLAPTAAPVEVRRAAVRLIGAQHDPRTVTILEILLFHAKERDPDDSVRREAAGALAGLPTPGVLPVLVRTLDEPDAEIREAGVRGIAAVTGKYFREKLETVPDAAAWPQERELYAKWWTSSAAGSLAKRDASLALVKLFQPIERGRRRLAEYALPALDDADAKTWRAGYDLFRALTAQDFGSATGEPDAAERARITQACRDWFRANGNQE